MLKLDSSSNTLNPYQAELESDSVRLSSVHLQPYVSYNISLYFHSQEDGWVICRVFKKKNLFKISNSNNNSSSNLGEGGVMSNDPSNSIFTQRNNNNMNQYLLQHDYSHLPLQYPQVEAGPQNYHLKQLMLTSSGSSYDHHHPHHLPTSTASDYDHHQPPPLINNMQVKQFMSSSTRDTDCESASPAAAPNPYQAGLDCDDHQSSSQPPNPMHDDQHWDRLVASNPTSINQINHLSLRSEMDFWAYPSK